MLALMESIVLPPYLLLSSSYATKSKRTFTAISALLANIKAGSCFQATRTISPDRTILKSSINADQMSSKMSFDFPAFKSIESELKSALEKARDIDKRYGLCTEPSQQAWSVVDSLYAKMQAFQSEKHEVSATSSKMEVKPNNSIEGKNYYFF